MHLMSVYSVWLGRGCCFPLQENFAPTLYTETENENEERINRWIAFIAFYGKRQIYIDICALIPFSVICVSVCERALWCCLKATVQCQSQFEMKREHLTTTTTTNENYECWSARNAQWNIIVWKCCVCGLLLSLLLLWL